MILKKPLNKRKFSGYHKTLLISYFILDGNKTFSRAARDNGHRSHPLSERETTNKMAIEISQTIWLRGKSRVQQSKRSYYDKISFIRLASSVSRLVARLPRGRACTPSSVGAQRSCLTCSKCACASRARTGPRSASLPCPAWPAASLGTRGLSARDWD